MTSPNTPDRVGGDTNRQIDSLGLSYELPDIDTSGIVAVDDDGTSLALLRSSLEGLGFPVRAYRDPGEALDSIRADPPTILVTDMVMPRLSGVDLAQSARAVDPDIGVILVTGVGSASTAQVTKQLGVSSFLMKPVDRKALARAVHKALLKRSIDEHNRQLVTWMYEAMDRNAEEIRAVTLGTLTSLINALDARSPHFRGHSQAVALQAAAVAQEMQLGERAVEEIRIAGLLHDVGMIGVPDTIVLKPDSLTPEETKLVRAHCEAGAAIVEPMKHLGAAWRFVLEHHERWDGTGYPGRKQRDEISLGGQIVGIAEAWTAIVESRSYREPRSREEGFEILMANRGSWFAEDVTEALLAADVGLIG